MSFQHEHDLDELAAEELERQAKDRRRIADPLACPFCGEGHSVEPCPPDLERKGGA